MYLDMRDLNIHSLSETEEVKVHVQKSALVSSSPSHTLFLLRLKSPIIGIIPDYLLFLKIPMPQTLIQTAIARQG
ncbi:MAG: hypothetical protein OHK0032_09640 [Thermodesulfovibrionales bacterium]